jgi:energy-coupling factor transport system permease protein
MTALVYVIQNDVFADLVRLVRRSRWLLLSLAALYAWTVNGTWLLPQLEGLSPTREGVELGIERIVRLVLLLAALALLLNKLRRNDLVYGLYQLAWPFSVLGFDRRAFAVRLALAMEWARADTLRVKTGMIDVLQSALRADERGPEHIQFESQALSWPDGIAMAVMLALLGVSL